ncbi:MAG: hypothetical protein ACK4NS_12070 [Saprospiraceae bacterium]
MNTPLPERLAVVRVRALALFMSAWASASLLQAQTVEFARRSPAQYALERIEMLTTRSLPFHAQLAPYPRPDALAALSTLDTLQTLPLSLRQDLRDLAEEIRAETPDSLPFKPPAQRGLWGAFFRSRANLFEVTTPHFAMQVNPMLYLSADFDRADSLLLFENSRGIEVRGQVDNFLYFYTNLIETQARFPSYVREWTRAQKAVPGAGFFKPFNTKRFDSRESFDFNVATAYIGFRLSRHIHLQFGHGAHFIGFGARSLLLSDFGPPRFFLRMHTRVWKLHYQNLFMELSPVSQIQVPDGTRLPKKYAALHYLSFRPTPRLSVGFFEGTILHRSRQFEFQYLNPVIFYRTVEGMIGSPDNIVLGADAHWDPKPGIRLYGQFMLDELIVSELLSRRGWWGNKYGVQAGLKYCDAFGVAHLDLQGEFNAVRPYAYAHGDSLNSYTHYNQPLAHPLGANFKEWVFAARYRPLPRLFMNARWIAYRRGEDQPGKNWGSNPLLSYDRRVQDFNNRTGQGDDRRVSHLALDIAWRFMPNLFGEFRMRLRTSASGDAPERRIAQPLGLALRWNMWPRDIDW